MQIHSRNRLNIVGEWHDGDIRTQARRGKSRGAPEIFPFA